MEELPKEVNRSTDFASKHSEIKKTREKRQKEDQGQKQASWPEKCSFHYEY